MKKPNLIWAWLMVLQAPAFAQDYDVNPTAVLDRLEKINQPPKACVVDPKMEYACDAMSEFSCKQGTFDDGTGKVLSEDEYTGKITPYLEKTKKYYSDAIYKMLQDQDPKFNLVRDLAVESMKQEGTPDCGAEKKSDRKSCYRRVSDLLAERHALIELYLPSRVMKKLENENQVKVDFASLQSLMNMKVYTDVVLKAHEKTQKLVADEKESRKVEKDIFPKVKKILTAKIEAMVSDPEVKRKLINKIESIAFAGSNCDDNNTPLGVSTSTGLLISNAFYQGSSNLFKYCNGKFLRNNSEFSIVKIVAHELSHSIDPCNIQGRFGTRGIKDYEKKSTIEELEAQFPFPGVLGCLHSQESIGAVSKFQQVGRDYPFCAGDQIGESFADWMGVEVLADYTEKYNSSLSPRQKLIGYSNVFRDYCNFPEPEEFDVHPSTKARIDRILMANPKIRKQIGCGEPKNGLHYCKSGEEFKGTRAVYIPETQPTPVPISPIEKGNP